MILPKTFHDHNLGLVYYLDTHPYKFVEQEKDNKKDDNSNDILSRVLLCRLLRIVIRIVLIIAHFRSVNAVGQILSNGIIIVSTTPVVVLI